MGASRRPLEEVCHGLVQLGGIGGAFAELPVAMNVSPREMSQLPVDVITAQVLAAHGVTAEAGLSSARVAALRAEFGPNELDQEEGTPLWKLVLEQFDDLLVKILCSHLTRKGYLIVYVLLRDVDVLWLRVGRFGYVHCLERL